MSAVANRHGIAITPVVTTAGTVNTTARLLTFTEDGTIAGNSIYVRPCWVSNLDADTDMYVRVNGTTAAPASATVFDYIVGPRTTRDVSEGGIIQVQTLSVWVPTGVSAVTDVVASGMRPG